MRTPRLFHILSPTIIDHLEAQLSAVIIETCATTITSRILDISTKERASWRM
jgi:hypothetical protein